MRKTVVLFVSVALMIVLASGVALALTKKSCTVGVVCYGTNGADMLVGTDAGDEMRARAGDDRIFGSDGSETIEMLSEFPRSGNDRICSHGGNDRIDARDGEADRIHCGAGDDDRVWIDPGIDVVLGECETVFP